MYFPFDLFRTGDLVEAVLEGRNGSVFCYGATGAGKTYTMLGTMENPGVMVLAIKDLFAKVRQRSLDGNHVVHLSYLEVYNETVRDLLSPGRPLILREDKQVNIKLKLPFVYFRLIALDKSTSVSFICLSLNVIEIRELWLLVSLSIELIPQMRFLLLIYTI